MNSFLGQHKTFSSEQLKFIIHQRTIQRLTPNSSDFYYSVVTTTVTANTTEKPALTISNKRDKHLGTAPERDAGKPKLTPNGQRCQ